MTRALQNSCPFRSSSPKSALTEGIKLSIRRADRLGDPVRIRETLVLASTTVFAFHPVRLLDPEGEMLGVVELDEAKRRAYDSGLDLVEIAPDSRPPVCKIMDFGKFKYEQSKKDKANKAKSKASEMKEVRLGRSMKIDPHDVSIRVAQARRFLIEGHRVQIIQQFRGREMAFRSKGDDRMDDIILRLADLAKVEVPPRLNGRRMGMILVPEKQKIEVYKKKMIAEGKPILPSVPELLEDFSHEDDDDDDDDDGLIEGGQH